MAAKLKTFTAETPIKAFELAKAECGENVVLVTTKQIQPKTLNKKPIYEILVSFEDEKKADVGDIKKQIAAYTNYQAKTPPKSPANNDILVDISKAAKELSKNVSATITQPKGNEYEKKIDDMAKQMGKLNDKISIIADMIWEDKSENRDDLAIPPEFATIYKLAKQSGMKNEHLKAILETTIQNMPTSMKTNPIAVKRYFYSLLRNMLPCRSQNNDNKRQKIMMFVGPTGVGKTTTLSKLAYKFAHTGNIRHKTGIITLDTYRLGAVEQLFQYAKIMSIPILDAIEIDDFKSALKSLNNCDLILIDTMGSSQYDKEKLTKLDDFLKKSGAKIDVNLVLSAGSKIEDLLEIYDNFAFLDIDTLIITKFDETKIFGNVFSLIYETNTPVSYFSVGQNVPDDIIEARSEFLVECVLEGFKKGDGDGPSR